VSKPIAERTHGKRVAAENAKLSPEQIRAASCQRSKTRNEARRVKRAAKAVANHVSPAEQLKRLDFRLGEAQGAKHERARLVKLLD
jgi:hypothetical protein